MITPLAIVCRTARRYLWSPALLLAAACHGHSPAVRWSRVYMVAPIPGMSAVVYGQILNPGDRPDTVVSVSTDAADSAAVHTSMNDMGMGSGPMTMMPVARVEVPKNGALIFSPGAYHIMLQHVRDGIKAGDSITVTAHLAHAGVISARAAVITYADVDTATAKSSSK